MSKLAIHGGKPVREQFLPPFRPTIGKEEIEEVVATLKSDWITTGPKTHKFEREFGKYVGAEHAIAVSSCTAALHLSLVLAGVGHGDEVITSPFTFTSTANVILHTGAKPVFADIEKDTYNISPKEIKKAITKKTKAITVVHYGGHPCEMDKILGIAKRHKLVVIEDAAHALGAVYKDKKIGGISDFTAFSFYATKNITTVEGGMVTVTNKELFDKGKMLLLHGISKDAWKRYSSEGSWFYEVIYPGFKYNMTDIQASLGLQQLKKLEAFLKKKEQLVKLYNKALKPIQGIITPSVRPGVRHGWHLYPIQIDTGALKIDRNRFIEALRAENIGTSVHFIPVHIHPYYAKTFGFKRGDFPVAERVYSRIVSIPLYPRMNKSDALDVITAIRKIVGHFKS